MSRILASLIVLASLSSVCSAARGQDAAAPYAFDKGYPTAEASQRARDDADLQRAIVAYRFWYPAVSVEGIFNGNRAVGLEVNKAMGAAAAGPRQVGFTLNSDTPYGSATLDLSNGPMVIEIPSGPYIGLADDHYQGWVLDMGLPGPDGGKGGKHLIVPPNYQDAYPPGYFVGHALSNKVLMAVRALPVNGNVAGAMEALGAIRIYPLSDAANPQPMKVVNTTETAMDSSNLKWEDNIAFWQKLHEIIDAEPVVEKFLPMYGLLSALGIEKGKPFTPTRGWQQSLSAPPKPAADSCWWRFSTATVPTGSLGRTAHGSGWVSCLAARISRRGLAWTSKRATAGSLRRLSPRPRCSDERPAQGPSIGSPRAMRWA